MKYVAYVGVQLGNISPSFDSDKWRQIEENDGIKYVWHLSKQNFYEIIAGLFDDKIVALTKAKNMFITVLHHFLRMQINIIDAGCSHYEKRMYHEEIDGSVENFANNENFFYSTEKYQGTRIGPGVYQVESNFDEFFEYVHIEGLLSSLVDIKKFEEINITENIFKYGRKSQEMLNNIIAAENSDNFGMRMTIYCAILEHMSIDGPEDEEIVSKLDGFIRQVNDSTLTSVKKEQMVGGLQSLKRTSSRKKCLEVISKYAKTSYGPFTARQLFNSAYTCRSDYAHGNDIREKEYDKASYIKYIVLDAFKNYFNKH